MACCIDAQAESRTGERAQLPIFDAIFADIGDYSRSSRTCHLFRARHNIDFISHHTTRHSLVLLDELVRPPIRKRGCAGSCYREYFRRAGCISIVSTHHTP